MALRKPTRRLPRWLKIVLGIGALGLAVVCGGLAVITFWPDVAAQNIDRLRDVIGDEPVAQLEETVLNIQDGIQQVEYQVGLLKPAAPWAIASADPSSKTSTSPTQPANSVSVAVTPSPTVSTGTPAPTGSNQSLSNPPSQTSIPPNVVIATSSPLSPVATTISPNGVITAQASASALPAWQLSPLSPFGTLPGEGQWSPYLTAPDGQTVAYRTFLQPDARRAYSVAAIVAFDLRATRLHFVLGTVEPLSAAPQAGRTGAIPDADMQPGVLLATFNGGFKARHGHYGAMADGLIAIPASKGLATVAMYADGLVKIGDWGTDIQDSSDLLAWRQNGELLIHNGQINPDTARTTQVWGLTIKGDAITWRSALGLSTDGQTLYYVAGLQLDVGTLTKAMAQTGATEALQLDVNAFWVHFAAIRSNGSILVAEPLLDGMKSQVDRYLKRSSRDFFYVTTALAH